MKKIIFLLLLLVIYIPNIKASYIVMDTANNRIIEGSNIHNKRSVASISKIMTAILAIESGKLEDTVVIGNEIDKSYGSGIYIKKGEEIKLIDLVYGLMLRSGNDAAYAIANYVGGSVDEFVEMMNLKALELKMNNTKFNNPNGLEVEGGNISTAYDMALLSSYAINNPIYQKIVGCKKYKLKTNMNTYIWDNKNKLLFMYKYTIGGKTGYTEIAKRTLVTNAKKDNMNLTIVTLNEANDFELHQNLYKEKFDIYQNYKILKKGKINIIGYNIDNGYLYINNNYNVTLSEIERENLMLKFEINKNYQKTDGNKIGKVIVSLYDKVLYEDDIYIKVYQDSFFNRLRKWFSGK